MTKGILFIAIGEQWQHEAALSASIVKKYMPSLPITVFTDQHFYSPFVDNVCLVQREMNPLLTKTICMNLSPYDYTLFLDTDITLCENIEDIFLLLDRFDLAVPHAPYRLENMGLSIPLPGFLSEDVPASFPGMNTGMLLFKHSEKIQNFFLSWREYHQQLCSLIPGAPNQPAFRTSLYRSDLRFAIIPEEYHCRFIYPFKVCGKVKVLHGRHPDIEFVINQLNSSALPRIGEGYFVEASKKTFPDQSMLPQHPMNGIPNGGIITLLKPEN